MSIMAAEGHFLRLPPATAQQFRLNLPALSQPANLCAAAFHGVAKKLSEFKAISIVLGTLGSTI